MKSTVNRPAGQGKTGFGESSPAFRSTFGERLTALLDRFPSRAKAGEIAGVHPDQFPKYVRETVKMPLQVAVRLCEAQNESLDWLVSDAQPQRHDATDGQSVTVPVMEVRAGAGPEQFAAGEEPASTLSLPRALLVAHGIRPDAARIVWSMGNSMEPTIKDGAPMVVDTSDVGERDDVYVMRRGAGITVKRLQHMADGSILLKSDNPAYEPDRLPKDDGDELKVIGRVGLVLQAI